MDRLRTQFSSSFTPIIMHMGPSKLTRSPNLISSRCGNCLVLYFLFLLLGSEAIAQQTVTGTVTDAESKESLPGVNILVKGTTSGTTSDIDGRFSLSFSDPQAVLVFSFVGYDTKEVAVGNSSQIDVSLDPDLSELGEVVVVGYGTVKTSSVTSAISKIENDKLDQIPAGRPETALVGRMAGVNISTNRSTPGAAPIIRIRGAGSISASNDPLVVIDGFAGGSLSNVNMNDVESIEVLKDASSAAIYGSRGAGGVIIVTTKKGRSGKAQLSV